MTTSATCPGCGTPYVSPGVSVAIERLKDEVRLVGATSTAYDRAHNRHMRS